MRLFVALDLPYETRQRLSLSAGGLPGVRWVPPENYHLTLRFIGKVVPHQAEEIDNALTSLRVPRFDLTLTGAGSFTRGNSAMLWVGLERSPALEHLHNKVETALQRAGFEADRKRYQPHVTLARTEGMPEAKLAGWIQSHNLFRAAPFTVEHFTLFSSQLGKDHPVYTAEADYPLS